VIQRRARCHERSPAARDPALRCIDGQPETSGDILDETIRRWQPRYPDRTLTREDARQIIENVSGFFSILQRWADAVPDAAVPAIPMAPQPNAAETFSRETPDGER
jgi:hypothetical protein